MVIAKLIIQTGITEVIYLSGNSASLDSFIASKKLFDTCENADKLSYL